ncbi:hypothetical protein GGX14DRAFT_401134 [Mycena pura]|uniref:Uncharacterized protein n=1 Tax=Mycena pura TaxID=153505 RepID=A0AAD6V3M1_9AGAR|nr:hypothetical protein GGX14DRAFT_401134 [Mycena pura]
MAIRKSSPFQYCSWDPVVRQVHFPVSRGVKCLQCHGNFGAFVSWAPFVSCGDPRQLPVDPGRSSSAAMSRCCKAAAAGLAIVGSAVLLTVERSHDAAQARRSNALKKRVFRVQEDLRSVTFVHGV